jgi:hypothetical protein
MLPVRLLAGIAGALAMLAGSAAAAASGQELKKTATVDWHES